MAMCNCDPCSLVTQNQDGNNEHGTTVLGSNRILGRFRMKNLVVVAIPPTESAAIAIASKSLQATKQQSPLC